jgi:hypothetical protein
MLPQYRSNPPSGLCTAPIQAARKPGIVALDESGRPCFNAPQNHLAGANLVYYVFDVMVLIGARGSSRERPPDLPAAHLLPLAFQLSGQGVLTAVIHIARVNTRTCAKVTGDVPRFVSRSRNWLP